MWCIILVNIIMSLHNVEVTARVLLSVFFSIAIQVTIILVIRFILIFFLPLSPSALLLDLSLWVTWRVSYNKHELHTLPQNVCSHSFWVFFLVFFGIVRVVHLFNLVCSSSFCVLRQMLQVSLDCLILIASFFYNVYSPFHAHFYLFWNVRSIFFCTEVLTSWWLSMNELAPHDSK